ncbi:MAG: signal recognition particle protein [Candidatus Marinimicrobia bacterium]|nr:signal recognition particle protein [Candidatus Neomarinimicrobiota bacterium]
MFDQLTDRFDSVLRNLRGLGKITDANIQQTAREIRRALLEADVNFKVARGFVERIEKKAQGTKVIKSIKPGEQFIKIIREELIQFMGAEAAPMNFAGTAPTVVLLAGLQGSGKTTTAAKLARYLKKQGKKPYLIAADIYRPAAVQQLQVLGRQIDVPVFSADNLNPVKICITGLEQGRKDGYDILILDTAGRLHIDNAMMNEITAIAQAVHPHETFFVVDGMTGQDAVNSALSFAQALDLTGIILTKLDGDARGGAAVSITEVTGKPVKFISNSEKMDGLEVFDPNRIVDRILGFGDVISLVEKAQQVIDEKQAEQLQKKIFENKFDLDDFKNQLLQLRKLGSMKQILGMMPGVNRKMMKNFQVDDRQLIWTEAIINSMTPGERSNPHLINGSRRKRIAHGSGRTVQEINQLLKQFTQMQKMMKRIGKSNLQNQLTSGNILGIN